MTTHKLLWWAILIALVVILALAAAQAARALRELKRMTSRIDGYADLPMVKALGRAEGYARRLETAAAQIDPLVARAIVAIAVIRRGPIPPEIRSGVARIVAEIAAFRRFAG